MHIAFALPAAAETGGVGGTAFIHAAAPALRVLGHQVEVLEGPDPSFPPGATPVIDGMLLPRLLPRLNELVATGAVALIHHVSAAAGQDAGARDAVRATERDMLPWFRRVVATSKPVAARLEKEFAVISPRLVLPGVPDLPRGTGPEEERCHVLSVGVLTPRKGHDRLLRAMARLTDLDWHLTIAGDARRNPVHATSIGALIDELGLASRTTLLADPTPDQLDAVWRQAGLFALATSWEGYPTATAEALRRGIPAVVTEGGESGVLLTPDCGAVCALDDPATFGKCLRRLIFDRTIRAGMATAAWTAGQALPGWDHQARLLAIMLES